MSLSDLNSEGLLMAGSCYWLSVVANSRYALESRRSKGVDFNNLRGC